MTLTSIDERHFHQDPDGGYTWGLEGERAWRVSTPAGLSERHNWYGEYDFSLGQCLIWEGGPCDGDAMCQFLERVASSAAGSPGQVVAVWDNAPSHIARVVTAHAEGLRIELVFLPGYSSDFNPIGWLWDRMREEVIRGHCQARLAELRAACQRFIAG